ncbi:copper homeostasis periplasmic binding protein CopC [Pseudomonas sp. 10B1]|uniref:copper homeostasis periplasmic binding protein CopC n=1 Tax=unclassified Pseudomonas TaxID=196821 RepID=UPI002AB376DC|nr:MULTISPECIES: copper homeostasis periplasmic binding protein CopC [unclassified Pseudomonas]MDY7560253.1 copper homeostasis periplasmic binding protein CopC [Pseudomonas sp. AB6]MEA9975632.1 copper homeostasis periplasmic binding protein CopC [Pseudomonas sp. RTS4]MEA9993883.1 copper homeostasis periplasmic binding protein CopC [Pseudomonas sp. AA4]MEB0085437.1 copper homeostasis periplasmic binding protein CopC [Pseudomonas sp. RTI1]MEB0124499.1 copper homeostasis periplasmic binding prote
MSAQRCKKVISSLVLLVSFATSTLVIAHAHLQSQTPAADSTVTPPTELRLNFSEGIEEKFTKVVLTTNTGKTVSVKSIATAVGDKKTLVVTPATPLVAGQYHVEWHAVSVDTHKSDGSYAFKVSP